MKNEKSKKKKLCNSTFTKKNTHTKTQIEMKESSNQLTAKALRNIGFKNKNCGLVVVASVAVSVRFVNEIMPTIARLNSLSDNYVKHTFN